ncbi:MAG TPA: aminotransferase class V-fold PLP-dependent enzyme, partial [Myxococcaceae bacterium]|nr:aminotransferase class V-fold PLP-dependent enzyme [Myxococcaceae bacterium]
MKTFEQIAGLIRHNEMGRQAFIDTPFGRRMLCYADLTATGRHLDFVEAWIDRVRPLYANTHTAVSSTGRIMSELREEARRVVARSVNAGGDDVVVFISPGATACVNKLIGLLGIRIGDPLERRYGLSQKIPAAERPVVFVGPYEHHSNELPWLESIAELVEVGLDDSGRIDLGDLESKLSRFASRPLKIGTFSAASNVTGVLSDVRAIARALHRAGAYAVFDYAAAAPYVPIDMHPGSEEERIDALFLSTHKFIGGPEGSGVLVANRELFRCRTPERPGGGTVDYVAAFDRVSVDYVRRLDEREEGGTPAILGDLRAGIAFLVKEMLGPQRILEHELKIAARATDRLSKHPRINVLGPRDLPRLAIISFNIPGLHHDLVSALLDHLFGIQNRAGCSCAGPYGHRLLGIGRAQSERYRVQIAQGILGIKPGWVRLSLPYYASEEDLDFILSAVEFVADHGMDFVPVYRLGWLNGVWRHIEHHASARAPVELSMEGLSESAVREERTPVTEEQLSAERSRYFAQARKTATELRARWEREPCRWNPP